MKSNDEEYLDSLLDSAQKSNSNNPQSALSRMSARNNSSGSAGSGDISALVHNSNGNKDLNDIGRMLDQLDNNELVDDRMADFLDRIERPSKPGIPKFTVGNNPSSLDVRDPEEIALDEAIADAERLEAEIRNGKFDNTSFLDEAEKQEQQATVQAPLVDIEESDDALLEMAPEVSLPEDENEILIGNKQDSDADQTPEEILTGLLDDLHENNLAEAQEPMPQESLSDVLDNMKEDLEDEPSEAPAQEEPAAPPAAEEPIVPPADAPAAGEGGLEDFSLSDLEAEMDQALGGNKDSANSPDNINLDDISIEGMDLGVLGEDEKLEAGEASAAPEVSPEPAEADTPSSQDLSADVDMAGISAQMESVGDTGADTSASSADLGIDGDEFNLDALEASLDNLIGAEEGDFSSTEGEVADVAPAADMTADIPKDESTGEDVSMQELDALMNSLANDEIGDIEGASSADSSAGAADDQASSDDNLFGALTEDGFEGIGDDVSLEELASIPERKSGGGSSSGAGGSVPSDDEEETGKKGKKEKKEGFFAKLFKALTREDEEPAGEGLASLTDENQQVLNELGEDDGKGKKKKKKEKKPKEKKAKEKKPPKPKKEKKPPKPKKEKKPKPPKDPGVPEKAISPKKVALAFIFAASLGVLVCIPAFILPDRITSQRAQSAYTHKEYTTAYKMLYGKEMNEDETLVYEQSRVLAWAQRYLDGYNNYTAMNMKEEALDMLLMAMRNKSDLLEEAAKYSVEIDVNSVYDSIESLLSESYGLSEADIQEINSIKKDRDYTIRLMEIVGTL